MDVVLSIPRPSDLPTDIVHPVYALSLLFELAIIEAGEAAQLGTISDQVSSDYISPIVQFYPSALGQNRSVWVDQINYGQAGLPLNNG